MPSTKKRINLTISDEVYERLQAFKRKNGITNDAAACTQLMIAQLNALENSSAMYDLLKRCSIEELMELSKTGLVDMKKIIDNSNP